MIISAETKSLYGKSEKEKLHYIQVKNKKAKFIK